MYYDVNNTNFPYDISKEYSKYNIPVGASVPNKYKSNLDDNINLFSYQKFIEEYMNKNSPYRGLLLYYGLGSGKTLTSINVAEQSGKEVVVLLPKSLRVNFIEELIKYVPKYQRPKDYSSLDEKEKRRIDKTLVNTISKKYSFISSNASTSSQKIFELSDGTSGSSSKLSDEALDQFTRQINSLDNKFLIIDEVHNLLNNMINPDTKNGTIIYDLIMSAKNLRILFLSGSPIVNDPFEIALLYNMLRGYMYEKNSKKKYTVFPDYREFNELFVDYDTNSMKNIQLFKERIVGLTSFYGGVKEQNNERNILPFKHPTKVERVPMSEYQWKKYLQVRIKEQEEERKQKFSKKQFTKMFNKKPMRAGGTTFRVKSRIISNFALPPGIERPEFTKKVSNAEIENAFKETLAAITEEQLTTGLRKYSPKMNVILDRIEKEEGCVFVYSQFISLEGIGIFARVLEANGYVNYMKGSVDSDMKSGDKDMKEGKNIKGVKGSFMIFSGNTSDMDKIKYLQIFNDKKNKDGKICKIILATATMAEGINLKNIRSVHIMEPYWNFSRIQQIIGRAIRIGSHSDLPSDEREVRSYIYLSSKPESVNMMKVLHEKYTTDESIFINAKRKQELVDQFLKAIKESAIDCTANYQHNKNELDHCFVCIPNNQTMYLPNIEDHSLPINRNCKVKLNDEINSNKFTGKSKEIKREKKYNGRNRSKSKMELVPGKSRTFRNISIKLT